jgi:hypothetical protein
MNKLNWDKFSQIAIALLGTSSIFMVSLDNNWGYVLGLASQPFWYVTSYHHKQWGVFGLSFIYTISWGIGVYTHFFK